MVSHNVLVKAVSGSLTVPVAGEAVNLVQSGVGFAHGVEFGMSEGALLSPRGWTSGKKGKECKISDSPKAEAQKQAEGHEGIRGDLQGVRMRVHLTIFTDVPFSPAGGCLLLLFLTRHQTEEGQRSPVDRKGEATCTHSEEEEGVIEARSGGESPWITSPNGGQDATQLQQEKRTSSATTPRIDSGADSRLAEPSTLVSNRLILFVAVAKV